MSEFTPITTQEDFDAAIQGRLKQQEKSIRAEYADYADLQKQAASFADKEKAYTDQIAALTGERDSARLSLSKVEAARKYGINLDDAKRLTGSTAEEIEADAKAWADSIRGRRTPAPVGGHDGGDNKNKATNADALAALRELRGK